MIEWDEKYSLGILEIDKEHKKLIGIINKAILAKKDNDSPEVLREVLIGMIVYAQTHFATEERCMLKFKYPEYQYHKEEHIVFSTKIKAFENDLIDVGCYNASEILDYLKEWFLNHVLETDRAYVDCFKEHGLM